MKSFFLSLVIPCYKEAEHLEKSLPRVVSVLSTLKKNFEIVIIDDCSTDGTHEIIDSFIKNNKSLPIQFIKHKKNVGRGGTVAEGIMHSKGEIVGFIDIDLEISPKYIPQCVEIISSKKEDVVVGKRYYPFLLGSFHRYIASKVYSLFVRTLLRLPISDTEAGYKFFRKEKILPILPLVKDKKWFWDTEIIAVSAEKKLRVSEINVLFERRNDKTSTVRFFRDSFEYLKCLIAYKVTHGKKE